MTLELSHNMDSPLTAASLSRELTEIHPSYFLAAGEGSTADPHPRSLDESGPLVKPRLQIGRAVPGWAILSLAGALILALSSQAIPLRAIVQQRWFVEAQTTSQLPATASVSKKDVDAQLSDIARILRYVVPTVKKLETSASAPAAPQTEAAQEQVLRVRVPRAALLQSAQAGAQVIMSVARNTELLTTHKQGQWYQVYAPTGELMWVHEEMVEQADAAHTERRL